MKKTPTLTILVGCPASGKSTYAEWIVKSEPKTMRVSRDEIRESQFATFLEQDSESMISKMINEQVKILLQNGWNVLLDNCHTKSDYIDAHIKQFNALANIDFKVFDLPIEELLIRNSKRIRKVPKKVIEKMFQQLQHLKTKFDFVPIKRASKNLGYKIILLSGREDKYEAPTLRFLENHKIEFDVLLMRKTADNRKDSIIKKEIFDVEIRDKYFVEFVLDDRNQVVDMWRNELQLPCFQVYYGDF